MKFINVIVLNALLLVANFSSESFARDALPSDALKVVTYVDPVCVNKALKSTILKPAATVKRVDAPTLAGQFRSKEVQNLLDKLGTDSHKFSEEVKKIIETNVGKDDANVSSLIADAARQELRHRHIDLVRAIRANPEDLTLRTFDHIVIGAGPQGATAASNAVGKTLVLNDSEYYGTFSKMGDTFFINSEEVAGKKSPNMLPGCKAQVHCFATKSFPEGRLLGNVTELNLALSDSEILLNTKAMRVEVAPPGSPARYKITTSKGTTFYTKNLTLTNGMGKETFPVKDAISKAIIGEEKKKLKPRIEFVDDFMARNQRIAETGKNPLNTFAQKRVVVVGGGDGGAIAAEYLFGHGPAAGYAYDATAASKAPKKVFWLGQKKMDDAAYRDGTWERYWDLAQHLPRRDGTVSAKDALLEPINAHFQRIEKITSGPDKGAFKVHFGEGPNDFVVADYIVSATGYDSSGPINLLKGLSANRSTHEIGMPFIKGRVDDIEHEVNIAKGVTVNGVEQPGIVVAGPATGGLDTMHEPGGEKSPRIEALSKRTASIVQKLNRQNPNPIISADTLHSPRLTLNIGSKARKSFTETISVNSKSTFRRASENQINQQIETRVRGAFKEISLNEKGLLDCTMTPNLALKTVSLKCKNLDQASLQKLTIMLKEQANLLPMIIDKAKTDASPLHFIFSADKNGAAVVKEMSYIH